MPHNLFYYFSILLNDASIEYTCYDQYDMRRLLDKNKTKRLIDKDGIILMKNNDTWQKFIEKDKRFKTDAPFLIVSHMNTDDLFEAACRCFGKNIDPDYKEMVMKDLVENDEQMKDEFKFMGEEVPDFYDGTAAYITDEE